ncbi:hypothetical protein BXZ70DRAFT_670038 [Cristinia sonorae]|uniref:F-box domain-containing protein n=1 Tax=Cristinia sonorae TaxID=1940300 RepID=A0A8K0UUJ4_9AGAR|nr:hypothetical protein BXZ70DRAFT_670038 [Cristinia sonorae]
MPPLRDTADTGRGINAGLNQDAPISRLPPEILSKIFICYAQTTKGATVGWPALTHICHYWREVALASPLLWTKIHVSNHPNTEPVASYIERSAEMPLSVRVRVETEPYTDSIHMILPELRRARKLHIMALIPILELLETHLQPSAPLLKSLVIFKTDVKFDFKLSIFNNCRMPALDRLSLIYVPLEWSTVVFPPSLTDLHIEAGRWYSSELNTSITDMVRVIQGLPLLKRLALSHVLKPVENGETEPILPVSLCQLEFIRINAPVSTCLRLLDHLTFPPSTALVCQFMGNIDPSLLGPLRSRLQALLAANRIDYISISTSVEFVARSSEPSSPDRLCFSLSMEGNILEGLFTHIPLPDVSELVVERAINTSDTKTEWIQLSQRLPNVDTLMFRSISPDALCLLAPIIPPEQSTGEPFYLFPKLRRVLLESLDSQGRSWSHSSDLHGEEPFIAALRSRKARGCGIKTVEVKQCSSICAEDIKVAEVYVDVKWDGIMKTVEDN